jgi:hypothetical protein
MTAPGNSSGGLGGCDGVGVEDARRVGGWRWRGGEEEDDEQVTVGGGGRR